MTPTTPPTHDLLERLRTMDGDAAAGVGARPPGFCAEGSLPAGALAVEVDGIGPLAAPLPPEAAEALHRASAPARFGQRSRTKLDRRVRDTGEMAADRVMLRWQPGVFAALCATVAESLGLPALQAGLHGLLVYGAGQFFKPHQDTAKPPGMVATLVLVWPSAHLGGTLRVEHQGREMQFVSQQLGRGGLRWFAFFADCRHEVLPVDEGWRVALTFDLVLPKTAAAPPAPPPDDSLVAALRARFGLGPGQTPSSRAWALLLDHEYSEHGLRWPLLKGADRARAGALRSAVRALGLTVSLALAELHEQWTAVPGRRRRGASHGMVADELVDSDTCLVFWVDADDVVRYEAALRLRDEDCVRLVENGAGHLVDEAYEGYMGNYGETLDYWYRRAAVVLRSPLALATARFEHDFDAALADACRLAETPEGAAALAPLIAAAAGTLAGAARQRAALLPAYARLAAALPDDEAARALLAPFHPMRWRADDAPALAALAQRRGTALIASCIDLAPLHRGPIDSIEEGSEAWNGTAAFIDACAAAGWPAELQANWLRRARGEAKAAWKALAWQPLAERSALQARLLEGARALAEATQRLRAPPAQVHASLAALVADLLPHIAALAPHTLMPLLRAVGRPADAALREAITQALHARLARPALQADDLRLPHIAWGCRCADCSALAAWAAAPAVQPLVFSMPENRRQHVEREIAAVTDLLVTETLRVGSPYKLLVRKRPGLPEADRDERAASLAALQSLQDG